jgi:hypothetical protein
LVLLLLTHQKRVFLSTLPPVLGLFLTVWSQTRRDCILDEMEKVPAEEIKVLPGLLDQALSSSLQEVSRICEVAVLYVVALDALEVRFIFSCELEDFRVISPGKVELEDVLVGCHLDLAQFVLVFLPRFHSDRVAHISIIEY